MKTKALISFAVTAKLICAFVFALVDCWFSHEAAQIIVDFVLFMRLLSSNLVIITSKQVGNFLENFIVKLLADVMENHCTLIRLSVTVSFSDAREPFLHEIMTLYSDFTSTCFLYLSKEYNTELKF